MEEPDNQGEIRNPDGTFKPGVSGNPAGRPKGKTMKEFAREYLMNLDDDKKKEWLDKVGFETIWKMAEGNPHQTEDITSDGEKIVPIYGSISRYNSDKKDIPAEQEDKSS